MSSVFASLRVLTIAMFASFVCLFAAVTLPAFALQQPTPEQIQAFKKLPPAEQQALAKQFGVDLGGLTAGAKASAAPVPPPVPEPRATPLPDLNTPIDTAAKTADPDPAKMAEPQTPQGHRQALKPFGYNLFAGSPSTFAPATDIPVPLNYIIGPGDSILVQLYGKQTAQYELVVDREGMVRFPELGPLSAAGQEFDEFKAALHHTISEKMIGVKASITMGALRSITIFVMGEAHRPGSYTVSSLSTITNALFVSGGITPIGSLRSIQLKRKGEVIGVIDLYDLLLKGDSKDDQRLLPGDVIFIPPVGKTVGVAGEVRRPAIYEIKDERTYKEVVALAGGELPTAYADGSRVERIDDAGNRTLVDIKLHTNTQLTPADGDVLTVASILEKMENVVLVNGHLQRPGGYQWRRGLRVSDLIKNVSALLPKPDLQYALIKREIPPTRKIEVVQFRLAEVFDRPGGRGDPLLQNRDEIVVFGKYDAKRMADITPIVEQIQAQTAFGQAPSVVSLKGNARFQGSYPLTPGLRVSDLIAIGDLGPHADLNYALLRREKLPSRDIEVLTLALDPASRHHDEKDPRLMPGDTLHLFSLAENDRAPLITPLLKQLERQAGLDARFPIVSVSGDVRFPGNYPLTPFMSVKDLITAAGGFTESAYGIDAEVSRTLINDTQFASFNRIDVVFGSRDRRVSDEHLLLTSRDQLYIKRVPNWNEQEYAEILGEVNFPGRYPIYKGDTLRDLVKRAGGLSAHANPKGAIFLREELRQREEEQLARLREQLNRDLASMQLEAAKQAAVGIESAAMGADLLAKATAAKATGRLSINLPALLSDEAASPITLRNGDKLVIPPPADEVSVMGEVQYPASHLHREGMSAQNYIALSGGTTHRSDEDRIYVIKANGEIIASRAFLGFSWQRAAIEPGDAIVVPYDVYQVSPLTYWTSVSQILFNLATTAAALQTVGVYQ